MKKYDTVIFDLDGTLLNTLEDLKDSVNAVMRTHDYPERTLEEVRGFVGNGIRKLMERAVPKEVAEDEFETVFDEFRTYYTGHCQIRTRAYDGIEQLLKRLKEAGYAMAIVSNKNQDAVTELHQIYFKEAIRTAIGQNEGIQKKPAPDTVFWALKELKKEPAHALYVGDSEVDLLTAQNAGMDCILVTWGFRTPKELEQLKPKAFIQKPEQLLELLEAWNLEENQNGSKKE